MSQLTGVAGAGAARAEPVGHGPSEARPAADREAAARGADRVEISSQARELSLSVRLGLVERIRHEIAEGTYDTDEKLESAVEKMLSDEQLSR